MTATPTGCHPHCSQEVNVKVTLTNTAPANAADLPPYIACGNAVPKGQVRTNVLLHAPSGGRVDDVHVIGPDQGVFSQTHNGLAVVGKTVQLKPGQRVFIDYKLLTEKGQPGIPVLRVTPVTLGKDVIGTSSRCS